MEKHLKPTERTFRSSVRSEFGIIKFLLIVLLILCSVFTLYERDYFFTRHTYYNNTSVKHLNMATQLEIRENPSLAEDDMTLYAAKGMPNRWISLRGNRVITQTFVAQEDQLEKLRLFFRNPAPYTIEEGDLLFEILDADGKLLCQTTFSPTMIRNDSTTWIDFSGNSEALNGNGISASRTVSVSNRSAYSLEKGATYTLRITSKNLKSKEDFGIYIGNDEYDDEHRILVDGEEQGTDRLYFSILYRRHNTKLVTMIVAIFILTILFVLFPLMSLSDSIANRLEKRGRKNVPLNILFHRILFVLTPFVSYFLLFKIAGHRTGDFAMTLLSVDGFMNLLVIGFVWWACYTLTNRTKASSLLTILIAFAFGWANYLLIQFRDCPLVATDLASIGTAGDVIANYSIPISKTAIWSIVIGTVFFSVVAAIPGYKGISFKRRIAVLLLLVGWGGAVTYFYSNEEFLVSNEQTISWFNTKGSYYRRGYASGFVISINSSRMKKPDGYSVEAVEEVAKKYPSDTAKPATTTTKGSPNVIVIMNEAFSDLQAINEFQTSTDYMPYINSLEENTIKGTLHTSIFGGSTADTEFEFLTGNSMMFLPFRSVPYNNRLQDVSPSFAWNLKDEGYGGMVAFHPGIATSYNRDVVYPNLGFDTSIFLDDLEDPEYLRSYVSDKADFEVIEQQYEEYKKAADSDAPFFLFNVTIQNHSEYRKNMGEVEQKVAITDESLSQEQAEQYLNLVYQSDKAFGDLVEYFKNVDEPTMIVMYGDHQPRVEEEFYAALYGKASTSLSAEESERKYQVPVVIWTNYDIEESDSLDISANYLGAYVADLAGRSLTGYQKYLLDLREELPVVTAMGYKDSSGQFYAVGEESEWSDRLQQYYIVEYNELVDTKNRVDDFYHLKK